MARSEQIYSPSVTDRKVGDTKEASEKLLIDANEEVKAMVNILNAGTNEQIVISGGRFNQCRYAVYWVAGILTCGLLFLIAFWKSDFKFRLLYETVPLDVAESLLIRSANGSVEIAPVEQSSADSIDEIKTGSEKTANGNADVDAKVFGSVNSDRLVNWKAKNKIGHGSEDTTCTRHFNHQKLRYIWNIEKRCFEKLISKWIMSSTPCSQFHETPGLSEEELANLRSQFGPNVIDVHLTPIFTLLVREALHPFYIFQFATISLWILLDYYIYSGCILTMSLICIVLIIVSTRRMQRALRETLYTTAEVTVLRDGEKQRLSSDQLVPGDLIELPANNFVMPCDAVLRTGSCVMGESMLTGESVPVTKTPIPNRTDEYFSLKHHAPHILYCGTMMLQSRRADQEEPVTAVVLQTAFATRKGDLVRSILFPKPWEFRFNRDSYYFMMGLAVFALAGSIYNTIVCSKTGFPTYILVIWFITTFSLVIPAALPSALTITMFFSQRRLRAKDIYCICPKFIMVSGAVNVVCFDKTGTLTEDTLDISEILANKGGKFEHLKLDGLAGHANEDESDNTATRIVQVMATCHSLVQIDGKLFGDPLDEKMFATTQWRLLEAAEETSGESSTTIVTPPSTGGGELSESTGFSVLRQFTFSSNLQRMSVIAMHLGSKRLYGFAKGSPEKIASLCDASTLPADFSEYLNSVTKKGYRVIGLAWKDLGDLSTQEVPRIDRDLVESRLCFLGLLVMENKLKLATRVTINELHQAGIRSVMVTGDNLQTAVTVAKLCSLLGNDQQPIEVDAEEDDHDHGGSKLRYYVTNADGLRSEIDQKLFFESHRFVLTGKSWNVLYNHYPDLLPQIATRGAVFARMSPEQKAQLVETLQKCDFYVAMCGDGANDCGALKAAHTGISLSEAEASVASPFTSKRADISCVPKLIREGRASLVGTIGVFKFLVLYGMTQSASCCILIWSGMMMNDFQFLWLDLFMAIPLMLSFCRTEPSDVLVRRTPPVSFLSFKPLFSTLFHIFAVFSFDFFVFFWTLDQPWCYAGRWSISRIYSHTNIVLWTMNIIQILAFAIVLSHASPFRRSIFTNKSLVVTLALSTASSLYLIIEPSESILKFLGYAQVPSLLYRIDVIFVGIANFLVCYIVERFLLENDLLSGILARLASLFSPSQSAASRRPSNGCSFQEDVGHKLHFVSHPDQMS